ncbi:MAG: PspC domain-containing protein [Gammaproteobacteria bacterium]|nr:PspC domain-containing protein [Gammaproteobacteria bacterium]MYF03270.1 PspC domain-containing protein [Gammaproteobacteria bacterium]MYI78074.1 PspC domain-containing protein [Gammaproteobacteria bacterium]
MNNRKTYSKAKEEFEERPIRRLYRDPEHGPLFGVCTGIADYLGIEPWIVRALTVVGVVCIAWIVIPAYIVAIFVMDKKPYDEEEMTPVHGRYRRSRRRYSRTSKGYTRTVDEFSDSAAKSSMIFRMGMVKRDIAQMEKKLSRMEHYITSGRYRLDEEFRALDS